MSSAISCPPSVAHVPYAGPAVAEPAAGAAAGHSQALDRATVLYVPDDHGLLTGIENNHLDWRHVQAMASV